MPKKKANGDTKGPTKALSKVADQEIVHPPWPKLQPLVPAQDLALDVVLEDQIVLIHKLFTAALSRQYATFLSSLPLTTTPGQPKRGEALRVNDRYQIQDPHFAETLWSSTPLKDLVTNSGYDWGGQVVGLNPNIRIYRYTRGQFFDQHYDESNSVTFPQTPPVQARTTWTLLLYLTGPETGCVGGETAFYPEYGQAKAFHGRQRGDPDPIVVAPEVGMALLHKHGDDCLLHEGREVTKGEKWIIRSDLCVKK